MSDKAPTDERPARLDPPGKAPQAKSPSAAAVTPPVLSAVGNQGLQQVIQRQPKDGSGAKSQGKGDAAKAEKGSGEKGSLPPDEFLWEPRDLLIYPLFVDIFNDLGGQNLTEEERKALKLNHVHPRAFQTLWTAWVYAMFKGGLSGDDLSFGDFLSVYSTSLDELGGLAGSEDVAMDSVSLLFGRKVDEYLASDRFIFRLKNHSLALVSTLALAQTGLSLYEGLKESDAEEGTFEKDAWVGHAGIGLWLVPTILDAQLKAPGFFNPKRLKSELNPAFAGGADPFAGGPIPSGLTAESSSGVGEGQGGSQYKFGGTFNLRQFVEMGNEAGPSSDDIANLHKDRRWQGSLWFHYDETEPTLKMREEKGKLDSLSFKGGGIFGGDGHLVLLEGGGRYTGKDAETLSSWFLRGGYGYSGKTGDTVQEIGFSATFLDWRAIDPLAPGAATGTARAGHSFEWTPQISLAGKVAPKHTLGFGTALSLVAGSHEGVDLSKILGSLSYTYLGNQGKDELPAFKVDVSGGFHRLDWWNPDSALIPGVETKLSTPRFFFGGKFLTGAAEIPEARSNLLGEGSPGMSLAPWTLIINAGVQADPTSFFNRKKK